MEKLQELIARQSNPLSWTRVYLQLLLTYFLACPLGSYWPVGLSIFDENGEHDDDRKIFTFNIRGMITFPPENSAYGNLNIASDGQRYITSRNGVERAALSRWHVAISSMGYSNESWVSLRNFIDGIDDIVSADVLDVPVTGHLCTSDIRRSTHYSFNHLLMVPKAIYSHLCIKLGIPRNKATIDDADLREDPEGFYSLETNHVADKRLDPVVHIPLEEGEQIPQYPSYLPPPPIGYKYGKFADLKINDIADFLVSIQTYTIGGPAVNRQCEL